jgi:hypothetical protein
LGTKGVQPATRQDQRISETLGIIVMAEGADDLFTIGQGLIGNPQGHKDKWCFLLRTHHSQ